MGDTPETPEMQPALALKSDERIREAGAALACEVAKATAGCDFDLEPGSFVAALEELAEKPKSVAGEDE